MHVHQTDAAIRAIPKKSLSKGHRSSSIAAGSPISEREINTRIAIPDSRLAKAIIPDLTVGSSSSHKSGPPHILLAAILIVCLGGIASQFGWFKSNELERITGQIFRNQVVDIDGKDFEDCTFENVTFRYRGGRFIFVRANIIGAKYFDTPDLSATGTINILKMLGFLEPNFANSWRSKSAKDFE